jgi:hypothetical protein
MTIQKPVTLQEAKSIARHLGLTLHKVRHSLPPFVLRYLPAAADCSHSRSFDQRRRPETLRTAMATAFFWPTQGSPDQGGPAHRR